MADGADRAYVAGLNLLARRELAEAQLRTRLVRLKFEDDEIDAAMTRLRRERALDDHRTALACARTQAGIKHRGRARVVRQIEALGTGRTGAYDACCHLAVRACRRQIHTPDRPSGDRDLDRRRADFRLQPRLLRPPPAAAHGGTAP